MFYENRAIRLFFFPSSLPFIFFKFTLRCNFFYSINSEICIHVNITSLEHKKCVWFLINVSPFLFTGPKQFQFGGHNYYFSWDQEDFLGVTPKNKKVDWLEARNECRKRCMDAVGLETEAELQMIFELVRSSKYFICLFSLKPWLNGYLYWSKVNVKVILVTFFFPRKHHIHMDKWSSLRLQRLWWTTRFETIKCQWMVLVQYQHQNGTNKPNSSWLEIPTLEWQGPHRGTSTW